MKRAQAQIICTLGPSSDQLAILRKMAASGMDVARLNFSHGSHSQHFNQIKFIRYLNKQLRRKILILQDLEGFRIRIGSLKNYPQRKIALQKNQTVFLTTDSKQEAPHRIPFDYEGPIRDIKDGQDIFIDDGNIHLRVQKTTKKCIKVKVLAPGIISENKGMNLPGVKLHFKGVSEKDQRDLAFGLNHHVDFVAQSFVRNQQDALSIKKIIDQRKKSCLLIAKIENREGLQDLDRILEVVDGIMIARGDLGVSLPIYKIPIIQKLIIEKCKRHKKFVITATQMLESMTERIRPTRAEVSDVANAIIDGSDFVMLSGETAAGRYPVESVRMMNHISRFTEDFLKKRLRTINQEIQESALLFD